MPGQLAIGPEPTPVAAGRPRGSVLPAGWVQPIDVAVRGRVRLHLVNPAYPADVDYDGRAWCGLLLAVGRWWRPSADPAYRPVDGPQWSLCPRCATRAAG